jgi:hypothetical protein
MLPLAGNEKFRVRGRVRVLVSAIGCKGEDVGVPKSNKLALMGLKPLAEPSRPLRDEEAFQISLNLAPFSSVPKTCLCSYTSSVRLGSRSA